MKSGNSPVVLTGIRNITISGRIGAGATTLAKNLTGFLRWQLLEGGDIFEKIHQDLGLSQVDSLKRPDAFDLKYEETIKEILKSKKNYIIQSHLAGFDAQKIEGVYKILIVCINKKGEDKRSIRIDRLMNREGVSAEDARTEVLEREKQNLEKFRRLYVNNDKTWVYWNSKYYNLIVNTYTLNKEESLDFVLGKLKLKNQFTKGV